MRQVPLVETKPKGRILSVSLMIMYAYWRYLLSSTIWSVSGLVYLAFVFVTVSLCYTVLRIGKIKLPLSSVICFPFILYTLFQYGINFNFEAASYWLDCFLLIIIAANTIFPYSIHDSMLIKSGVVVSIGIFVQMLFPDFYYSNVASNFSSYAQIRYWGSVMNYAGFTYQLGHSAAILIVAEGVLLYIYKRRLKPFWRFLMILLFVVSIFLTGKRMLAMLSVVVPLIVYYFSGSSFNKRAKRLLLFALIISLGLFVVITNIDYLASTNIGIFTRFASTLDLFRQGESIASSRNFLIQIAIDTFKNNPVLGIGAGNFVSVTGAETDVHNAYIQTLCESGIIGLTFFIVMLLYYVLKTITLIRKSKENKEYLQFSLFIQLVFILNSFTENGTRNLSDYFLYFVAIGVCIYMDMKENRVQHHCRAKEGTE